MATRQKLMQVLTRETRRRKPKPQLREAAKHKSWGIMKGDTVQVIGNHPERGKQGIVKEVFKAKDRVIVEGVNMYSKRIPANEALGTSAHSVDKEKTIHYSKVNLVDPETKKPTRFRWKFLEDGTKVRMSTKSGAIIAKPPPSFDDRDVISSFVSDRCTVDEDVWEQTYFPDAGTK